MSTAEAYHLKDMYSADALQIQIDVRETALVVALAENNGRKASNIKSRLRVYRAALAIKTAQLPKVQP